MGAVVPYIVTVRNHGSSVTGAAVVESGLFNTTHRYVYPLELPAGTVKRFTIYPRIEGNGDDATLRFIGGIRAHDISLTTGLRYGQERLVCLISDRIGAISVVKSARPNATPMPGGPPTPGSPPSPYRGRNYALTPFTDCYAKPEDAPERAVGYQGVSALVLSDGAERMNAAQWSAIRHWVLGGGSLIVLGGPSAAYVKSPDAEPLMPIRDAHGSTVGAISLTTELVSFMPPGPYAITTGAPVAGARVDVPSQNGPLLVTRPYGSGTVLFVAFSPMESPLKGFENSVGLWQYILSTASVPARGSTLWTSSGWNEENGGGPPMPGQNASVNPFRIQLPPVEVVIGILSLYFVLVVPVTYWVLKRKQRLEWAWVTSPILSVAFAFAFYLFTASLYSAGLSRRTTGTLVAAAGTSDAEFIGATELFFPRGGSYNLSVPNAESLEAVRLAEMYYSSQANIHQDMETVDNGAVSAPDFGVSNLSFRRLYQTQNRALGGAITAELRVAPSGGFTGTVTNHTSMTLHNAFVVWPERCMYSNCWKIGPGETLKVDGDTTWDEAVFNRYGSRRLPPGQYAVGWARSGHPEALNRFRQRSAGAAIGGAFVLAETDGTAFGPQLGKDVGQGDTVDVIVSVPALGGAK